MTKYLLGNAKKKLVEMTHQDFARVKGANGVAILIWSDSQSADAALRQSGMGSYMQVLEISDAELAELQGRIGDSQVTFAEAGGI